MREHVILVDDYDRQVGIGEKMQTHQDGRLHRAFSIFVFDSAGRLLLQKRSATKYHSANLWSNTCCGHPKPTESTLTAAHRRLQHELTIDCELHEQFTFRYRVELSNRLVENEFDHVLVGECNTEPLPNVAEVQDWRWISLSDLAKQLEQHPAEYTYWLRLAIAKWQPEHPELELSCWPNR
jgi:isopentenyl-diphosphate Delta-isomerase